MTDVSFKLKGIFPALLTPFNDDESINTEALTALVKRLASKGVQGFYVGGSTGESMVMSNEERKLVFKTVKEACPDNLALIAHVGAISTEMAIDMGKYAKSLGYTAISAVAPFYYSFKLEEILQYYRDIVNAVDMPMIIYNFPLAGGFSLTPAIAKELFADPRFVGIKHTSNDFFALDGFRQISDKLALFNGYDEVMLAGLGMGASGGIGSTYNVMPEKYLALYEAFNNGEIKKAQAIQKEICEIIRVMIKCGVMQSEKYLVSKAGIPMGDCRKPFSKLTEESKKILDSITSLNFN